MTIVWCDPHEVGRRTRIQIINQNTIGDGTTSTWIREDKLVTTRRTTCNILEDDERIMNRLIRRVRTSITARGNILVFKISLPT